jgi:hypothetical protein
VKAPDDDGLNALLQTIITRLMKLLTRQDVLVQDMGQTYLAEPDAAGDEARTLRPLQAAADASTPSHFAAPHRSPGEVVSQSCAAQEGRLDFRCASNDGQASGVRRLN